MSLIKCLPFQSPFQSSGLITASVPCGILFSTEVLPTCCKAFWSMVHQLAAESGPSSTTCWMISEQMRSRTESCRMRCRALNSVFFRSLSSKTSSSLVSLGSWRMNSDFVGYPLVPMYVSYAPSCSRVFSDIGLGRRCGTTSAKVVFSIRKDY